MLCGGIIAILIDEKCSLKTALYKARFIIISVGLAAISYKIVLDIFKKIGKSEDAYNNQMIGIEDLPLRVLKAFELGFKHFFSYQEHFVSLSMSVCVVIFAIIALVLLLKMKLKKSIKFCIILLFIAAMVSSQTHIILSKTINTGILVNFYGVLFLRVLVVALAFKLCAECVRTQNLTQNLSFILSCVFIWMCVVQDLEAQKVHKLAMERDFREINRIINRIEQDEHFSYNKQYCGVMFGMVENFSTRDYFTNLFQWFHLHPVLAYTMKKDVFAKCTIYSDLIQDQDYKNNAQFTSSFHNIIKRLDKAGILDELQPFPHKNSVVVFEDIIVFVASRGNLDEIRAEAKKWRENEGAQ